MTGWVKDTPKKNKTNYSNSVRSIVALAFNPTAATQVTHIFALSRRTIDANSIHTNESFSLSRFRDKSSSYYIFGHKYSLCKLNWIAAVVHCSCRHITQNAKCYSSGYSHMRYVFIFVLFWRLNEKNEQNICGCVLFSSSQFTSIE